MDASLIGLIGVVIGGVLTIVAQWFQHRWEQKQAQERAHAMTGAYVEGILEMEEDLQHIELYRQWLNSEMRAKDLPRILGAKEFPKDEMKTAIIGQLGSLSPTVASDMVLFFNRLESIDISAREMALPKAIEDGDLRELVKKHVAMIERMQQLGYELVRRLGDDRR